MKKLVAILCIIMLLAAAGCSSSNDISEGESQDIDTPENEMEEDKDQEEEGLEVEKGLLNVSITIPASMFEGQDMNEEVEEMKQEGIKDVKVNDDGSLTMKMSKSQHRQMMEDMKKEMIGQFEEYKSSDEYPSIQDIKYDNDFTDISLEVDQSKYEEGFDGFAVLGMSLTTALYHIYDGVPAEDVEFKIDIKNADSGQVFDTILYPKDFEDLE